MQRYVNIRKRILSEMRARLPYIVDEEKTGCELSKLEKTGISVFTKVQIIKIMTAEVMPFISLAKKNFVLSMLISDKDANI